MRGSSLARKIDMEYRKRREAQKKKEENSKKNTSKISENKK